MIDSIVAALVVLVLAFLGFCSIVVFLVAGFWPMVMLVGISLLATVVMFSAARWFP